MTMLRKKLLFNTTKYILKHPSYGIGITVKALSIFKTYVSYASQYIFSRLVGSVDHHHTWMPPLQGPAEVAPRHGDRVYKLDEVCNPYFSLEKTLHHIFNFGKRILPEHR